MTNIDTNNQKRVEVTKSSDKQLKASEKTKWNITKLQNKPEKKLYKRKLRIMKTPV